MDRCSEHLDALYALALLELGECRLAEEAVADAIAGTAGDPTMVTAAPAAVWHLLVAHVDQAREEHCLSGTGSARVKMPALSRSQRETMALLAGGRQPHEVVDLLSLTLAEVHDEIQSGVDVLAAAFRSP